MSVKKTSTKEIVLLSFSDNRYYVHSMDNKGKVKSKPLRVANEKEVEEWKKRYAEMVKGFTAKCARCGQKYPRYMSFPDSDEIYCIGCYMDILESDENSEFMAERKP